MRLPAPPAWLFWLWVGWILFSQTSAAGRLADAFFALLFDPAPGPVAWTHFAAQKGYHVLLFAGLGALLGVSSGPLPGGRGSGGGLAGLRGAGGDRLRVVAWCVGLGVFAESLQVLSVNRNASPWDALLNVASALAAYWLTARAAAPSSRQGSSVRLPR